MNKFAQERGWLDRKIEEYHPGKVLDKQPPAYVEKLDELRKVDDEIRQIAVGEGDSKSLKDLLKLSKQKLSEREYILCFRYLAEFHERAYEISKKLNDLSLDFDKAYDEIMVPEDFESEKEYLENISKRFKTSQLNNNSIIVTAGIIDWIKDNFGSDRRKTLAYWEKINPKQSKVIKSETSSLISQSQSLLTKLLSSLKEMSSLRNKRKVYQYGDVAKKFLKDFNIYHSNFQKYHDNHIVPFLKKYKSFNENVSQETVQENIDESKQTDPEVRELRPLEMVNFLELNGYEADLSYVEDQYKSSSKKNPERKSNADNNEIKCPLCAGTGNYWRSIKDPNKLISGKYACRLCAGTGFVDSTKINKKQDLSSKPSPAESIAEKNVIQQSPVSSQPVENQSSNEDIIIEPIVDEPPVKSTTKAPTSTDLVNPLTGKPLPAGPPGRKAKSNNNFIEMLESLSSESPLILKSIILKEAKQLYNTDKNKALKLIEIAKRIK